MFPDALSVAGIFIGIGAQTTLRSIPGQSELDDVLSQRETINKTLQQVIDAQTDPWGIKVWAVEIKPVDLRRKQKIVSGVNRNGASAL